MIREIGNAIRSLGEGTVRESGNIYKGAQYAALNSNKISRIGGSIGRKIGKHPYLATGTAAASVGVVGVSSGVSGLQGRSSGVNGLSGRSSGGY